MRTVKHWYRLLKKAVEILSNLYLVTLLWEWGLNEGSRGPLQPHWFWAQSGWFPLSHIPHLPSELLVPSVQLLNTLSSSHLCLKARYPLMLQPPQLNRGTEILNGSGLGRIKWKQQVRSQHVLCESQISWRYKLSLMLWFWLLHNNNLGESWSSWSFALQGCEKDKNSKDLDLQR